MAILNDIASEAGKVVEGAVDQVGNTFQAFIYGFPAHTANYGTYNPDWFTEAEAPDPTSFSFEGMGMGDLRHIMDGVGLEQQEPVMDDDFYSTYGGPILE